MTPRDQTDESQRRQATVVFADISGFTAMSEKLDPEDVTVVMNSCFEMIEKIVHEHGGTVDKYIGDCVMALFGAAHAIENGAEHAVSAALQIRAGLVRFNAENSLPVPLEVHIGVNSGLVIAGAVGGQKKRDFTVMGDTVNLAARLEDASEKGQIFVGPTTYSNTRDAFEYRRLQPLKLKGKAEPVQAYELVAAKQKAPTSKLGTATRQISAELVGREEELGRLDDRISRFLEGEGGIVSIIGEAGIGKSRLLGELANLRSLDKGLVLLGRSDSMGTQLSYHPFIDLLKDWAAIKPSDSEPESVRKLSAAIETLFPSSYSEVLPFIATLMGIRLEGELAERLSGIDADAMEKLILKAMGDLLIALAEREPLVLCFEDLHWADLSSVKMIEALLRLTADHQVLFVFAFRPGFNDTSERLLETTRKRFARQNFEIFLDRLSDRSSGTLIRKLLKVAELPHATRDLIVRRAEGNPFFIEEVIRSLIDQEAIAIEDNALKPTRQIETVTIPGTIQDVIRVRVEQLDMSVRAVLEVASVIGRSFYHRILIGLVGADADLEGHLQLLKERQVLEERTVRRTASVRRHTLATEREFVFKHALIQETIYESLLNRRRKELHLRVARTIESVFGDRLVDFYGMLAFHYTRGDELEKAEDYLLRAGDEAVRSAASSEALTYFREAHRIYRLIHGDGGDPDKKRLLEKNLASALLLTGHLAESRPHFDRALEYLGECVPRSLGQGYRQIARDFVRLLTRVYLFRGRMPSRPCTPQTREALTLLYNRARAESVADPEWFLLDSMYMTGRLTTVDPKSFDEAFAQWAGVALMFSYSGLSFDISGRVYKIARACLQPERVNDLMTYHLMNFMRDYFEGRWHDPCAIDAELVDRVTRTGKLWDVDTFLGMDAEKQIDLGDFPAVEARLDQITTLLDDYGYRFAETNKLAISAYLALTHRRLDEALELIGQYGERPEEMLNLIALGTRARIQILQSDLDGAEATLEQADGLAARMSQRPFGAPTPFHSTAYRTARLSYAVARLEEAVGGGNWSAIRRSRRRAASDIKQTLRTAAKMARMRTETYRLVGTCYWLSKRPRAAERWWTRSIEEGTRLGARPELARTWAEVGRRLATPGARVATIGKTTAEEYLRLAEGAFREMGLEGDLHGLESIRSARRAA